jgi:uncharacterized membrane protein
MGRRVGSLYFFQTASALSLVALILLRLGWELWLAPLRPGGSLLALKALPLALPCGDRGPDHEGESR